ncbi:MAG: radical SAM protein [Leptospirales bacterium]
MKILLIGPVFQADKATQDGLAIPSLSLHILAALTPAEHEVVIVDEERGVLTDTNEECDLVGISCYTSNIRRCYKLASAFRERGIPVVLGGIHPSAVPKESIRYADAVVIGEAENVWQNLLKDVQNNKLKKMYKGSFPDLKEYLPLKTRKPKLSQAFGVVVTETSRGCPYTCDFCSVYLHYGRTQRHKPVEHVVRDLVEVGAKRVFFVDDNIMGNPNYARELMKQLTPLKIQWAAQTSIKVIQKNPDLLKLAVQSGCQGLFFGIESISDASLKAFHKNIKDKQMIFDTLKMVRDAGIFIYAGMIFGFDEHTEEVFDEAIEFIYKSKISSVNFTYLTPFPGTVLFDRLQKENRIISTNWDDYHFTWGRVPFLPKHFSPEKLLQETLRVKLEVSKLGSLLKRFPANWHHPIYYSAINYELNREAKMIKKYHEDYRSNNIITPSTFQLE